ncbi:peptidase C39 family protein [Streptomyces koyangensis]|uniref:peptidase C39 family protein n=1 Tax=Streptomyces TaxID=1883 RepID=UPI00336DEA03
MPFPQETTVRSVVVPFTPDAPPAARAKLGGAVPERWHTVDRSAHAPHLVGVPGDDGEWKAAALVSARPHTSYLKIVDAVGDVPAAVEAVLAHARREGLAQVKWEGWTATPEQAAAAGFTPLRPPVTREPAGPETGYVRWLHDSTVAEPPYYGQTTHFTCGAVTALVAQAHAGVLEPAALDRRAELTLWRDATNFPVCEPVGLGVAVRRAWPACPVEVRLDTDGPVLVDHHPQSEQEWRADLQRMSREDAVRTGVPVDPRPLTAGEIREAVGRGERVLLLVSLARMQGFDVPHWVLCHGAVPGALLIEDPWTGAERGESWVDAHLLPVADAELDAMSAFSADGFHGAVVLGRP